MKELTRTRRLTVASVLFVIVIIIGLVTLRKPDFEYQITNEIMLEEVYNIDNEMLPDEAMEILAYEDSSFIFVDLRNPWEFNKGYLGNAINIPVSDILEEESISFYHQMAKDSVTIILYANDQREATGPWMLLKQLGINNMKILLGGYEYIANEEIDYYDMPEIPEYFVEEPMMDFAAFMETIGSQEINEPEQEKKVIQPVKRKKKVISEGGC